MNFFQLYPDIHLDVLEDELIICSTIVDAENYSLLTTRRFVTKEKGVEDIGYLEGAKSDTPPLNHKFEKYGYVVGTVQLQNGNTFRYFLEAGKPAAVMTFGIITLIWSQQLTGPQMVNLMRLWDKRDNNKPAVRCL